MSICVQYKLSSTRLNAVFALKLFAAMRQHLEENAAWRQLKQNYSQLLPLLCQPKKYQPRTKSPSGGRAEVLRRGTSRMDAARGVMGQGGPMYAGPRSNTGTRDVERSETRMQGRVSFAYFSLHGQIKVRRPRGRNTSRQRIRCCAERLCNSRVMLGIAKLNLRAPSHPTLLLLLAPQPFCRHVAHCFGRPIFYPSHKCAIKLEARAASLRQKSANILCISIGRSDRCFCRYRVAVPVETIHPEFSK